MRQIKNDKGVAGLEILLAIITMIFATGMLVMIFIIMAGKMIDTDALYFTTDSISVSAETLTTMDNTGENFSVVNYRNVNCVIVGVRNASNDATILSGNYTQTNCYLANATAQFGGYNWEVNYTYTYLRDTGAVATINDTSNALSGVTDWFSIIIIIACMVVLILLTVIIISAIKGTGNMGEGNNGNGNSGTA